MQLFNVKLLPALLITCLFTTVLLADTCRVDSAEMADCAPSLRELAEARDRLIGAAAEPQPIKEEPQYAAVLAREFNLMTTENALKMGLLRPDRDSYFFDDVDDLVEFAQAHDMKVRGHTLIWHQQLPPWLENGSFTRDELMVILRKHITTVVSRYRGEVYAWDVVNEAVDDDGSLRRSIFWQVIGPEYIEYAFQWAHEADPDALLFYNDTGGEGLGQKSDGIYRLVKSLVQKGVPVHGVGLQMHTGTGHPPNVHDIEQNMKRIADLGLQVHITEMDVRTDVTAEDQQGQLEAQARIYASVADLCLAQPACTAFVTWGFSDRNYERAGRPDTPLIFDARYQPKPAYWALVNVFCRYPRSVCRDDTPLED